MQAIFSNCAVNKATSFVTGVGNNSVNWVSVSPISGSTVRSFGKATQFAGAQQILGVNSQGQTTFYYISQPFTLVNIASLPSSASITADQVGMSIKSAVSALGSKGYINMSSMVMGASLPTIYPPISLGLSIQSLLMPICGGQINWPSVGIYGVILLLVLLLVWWRRRPMMGF